MTRKKQDGREQGLLVSLSNPKAFKAVFLLTALFLLASLLVSEHVRGTIVLSWQNLPLASINHELGYCYQAPLGRVWMSSHEKPSPAQLLENGVPLGPGNSLHDDIRKIGRGKFSFWYDYLYFSTSDNSDPRTNKNKYEVLWPTPVSKWGARGLYFVTLILAVLSGFLISQTKWHLAASKIFAKRNLGSYLKVKIPPVSLSNAKTVKVVLLLTALFLSASFLVVEHARGALVLSWQKLPLASTNHEIGFCYQAPLGRVWMSSHEKPSPAQLLENGVPLGPGNSVHDDIRKIGRGKFSFWYDYLYFSTSDNSDPRTNKNKYEVLWPTPVSKWGARGLYFVTLILAILSGFLISQTKWHLAPPKIFAKRNPVSYLKAKIPPVSLSNPKTVKVVLLLTALFLSASFLVVEHAQGALVLSWQKISLKSIRHELSFCYQAPLGRTWMSSHEKPSPARLFENGVPLGPGNSLHDDIRKIGGGRFSFWYDYLYFSTSDNSDPRTNKNKYEILWPTPVNRWVELGLYFITLVLTVLSAFLISRAATQSTLAKIFEKKSLHLFLKATAGILITLALFFVCTLLFDPGQALETAEGIFTNLAIDVLCCILGFHLARLVYPPRARFSFSKLGRTVSMLALLLFLLFSPAAGVYITTLKFHLLGLLIPLAFGFLTRLILLNIQPSCILTVLPAGWASIWKTRRLALVIVLCALIALPSILKPVVSWWDNSGWMDSQMYDHNAHDIATGKVLAGNGFVMPLYQYGMALFYASFGHFFYVQQIINVIMAVLAVVFLCLTAWNLFRNYSAVVIAGIIAANIRQLHYYVQTTQIESWYLPLIALTLFAWSCYWRRPSLAHLVFLSFATGLALNCRSQGTFYYGLLVMAPLFAGGLIWRKRVAHFVLAGLIVGATLLPWSSRNYLYEKSFSPVSGQADVTLVLNNHNIPFYGLFENNWVKYLDEYEKKYPNKTDRLKVMKQDFIRDTFGDPKWLAKAVFWRSIAFYSLLPTGTWTPDGPRLTDWKAQWMGYVHSGFRSLFLIGIGLLGLITKPGRTTIFLALAVISQVVMVVAVPMTDSRYGFPVIPIHIILGLFAFIPLDRLQRTLCNSTEEFQLFSKQRLRALTIAGLFTLMFMLLCYVSFGKANLIRPLREKAMLGDSRLTPDLGLRSLNAYYEWARKKDGEAPIFKVGDRIRFRCRVTNDMLPPRWIGRISYLPSFAWDPARETYYYSYPADSAPGACGLSLFGATTNGEVRENDMVDVEGTILYVDRENQSLAVWFWVKADKIFSTRKPAT